MKKIYTALGWVFCEIPFRVWEIEWLANKPMIRDVLKLLHSIGCYFYGKVSNVGEK